MASSGIVDIAKNRSERRSVTFEFLLSDFIRMLSTHFATGEEIRLFTLDNRTLHHSLHIPFDSFVSDVLVVVAGIFSSWHDTGADMDLQMEFSCTVC